MIVPNFKYKFCEMRGPWSYAQMCQVASLGGESSMETGKALEPKLMIQI